MHTLLRYKIKIPFVVGLWWGFVATIRLVLPDLAYSYTWKQYFSAFFILTIFTIFITAIISFIYMGIFRGRVSVRKMWVFSLSIPVVVHVIIFLIKEFVYSASFTGQHSSYNLYLPLIGTIVVLFMIFIIMYIIRYLERFEGKRILSIITGLLLMGVILSPYLTRAFNTITADKESGALPDVILISLDTVRADHMPSYGYFRRTTPYLYSLAQDSVLFENAVAHIPWTLGSHISILCSKYPRGTDVSGEAISLNTFDNCIQNLLQNKGYVCGSFISSTVLNKKYTRFSEFNTYNDIFSILSLLTHSDLYLMMELSGITRLILSEDIRLAGSIRKAEGTTKAALEWVNLCNESTPLFLWVHYYDPHYPLEPPEKFRKKFVNSHKLDKFIEERIDFKYWREKNVTKNTIMERNNLYDAELAYMDFWIKHLVVKFRKIRNKSPYIVVISDHGTSMGEHRYFGKAARLYDEIIKVPFFIKLPSSKSARISTQVESVDIMPTILELLKMPIPEGTDGNSLVPLIEGRKLEDNAGYSLTLKNPKRYSIRTDKYKFIYNNTVKNPFELYNLEVDPLEIKNLAGKNVDSLSPVVKSLFQRLREWMNSKKKIEQLKKKPLTPEQKETLKALGYVE